MKNFKTKEEAFASQNFDPSLVKLEGVPEQHVEAVKSIINLFVAHDAINPKFQPDFTNKLQDKYNPYFYGFSPSGAGFAYALYDCWTYDFDCRLPPCQRKPKSLRACS